MGRRNDYGNQKSKTSKQVLRPVVVDLSDVGACEVFLRTAFLMSMINIECILQYYYRTRALVCRLIIAAAIPHTERIIDNEANLVPAIYGLLIMIREKSALVAYEHVLRQVGVKHFLDFHSQSILRTLIR